MSSQLSNAKWLCDKYFKSNNHKAIIVMSVPASKTHHTLLKLITAEKLFFQDSSKSSKLLRNYIKVLKLTKIVASVKKWHFYC